MRGGASARIGENDRASASSGVDAAGRSPRYFLKIRTAAEPILFKIQFTREYEKISVNAPDRQDVRTLVDVPADEVALVNVVVKTICLLKLKCLLTR